MAPAIEKIKMLLCMVATDDRIDMALREEAVKHFEHLISTHPN